jgi:hypothetical protein
MQGGNNLLWVDDLGRFSWFKMSWCDFHDSRWVQMILYEFTWFLWSKMSSHESMLRSWLYWLIKKVKSSMKKLGKKTFNSQSSTTFSQYKQCVRRISVIHQRRILIFIVFQLLVKRWAGLNCWTELIRRFFFEWIRISYSIWHFLSWVIYRHFADF